MYKYNLHLYLNLYIYLHHSFDSCLNLYLYSYSNILTSNFILYQSLGLNHKLQSLLQSKTKAKALTFTILNIDINLNLNFILLSLISILKGQCHKILCVGFSSNSPSWSHQRYPGTISIFSESLRRYSPKSWLSGV